jgi:hypothetical protein
MVGRRCDGRVLTAERKLCRQESSGWRAPRKMGSEQNFVLALSRFGWIGILNFDLTPFFATNSIASRAVSIRLLAYFAYKKRIKHPNAAQESLAWR